MVVGAFATSCVRAHLPALMALGLQMLLVVEDYTEGHHHQQSYVYTCHNGLCYGVHDRGDQPLLYWSDENLFTNLAEGPIGNGYYIRTLARFGPQRLIHISTVPTAATIENFSVRTVTDPSDKVVDCRPQRCVIGLQRVDYDHEISPLRYVNQPVPTYRDRNRFVTAFFDGLNKMGVTWNGYRLVIKWSPALFVFQLFIKCVLNSLNNVAARLGAPLLPDPIYEDQCPAYYVGGRYADDWEEFISHITTYPHGGLDLPVGFYSVSRWGIVRVPPAHPRCNYTNTLPIAREFAAQCGASLQAANRILLSLYGPSPMIPVSDDVVSQPPDVVSCELSTAFEVSVNAPVDNKVLIARLDPNHSDFSFASPTAESVKKTVELRVAQPTAGDTRTSVKRRLVDFWRRFRLPSVVAGLQEPDFSHFPSAKRNLYQRTYEALVTATAGYNTFLKTEVLPSLNIEKGKATRMIQANNKRFNVLVFNWFHEFERILLSVTHRDVSIFAKGKSMPERLVDIRKLLERYRYVWSCDFKNFDGHLKGDIYLAELDFYEALGLSANVAESLRKAKLHGVICADLPMRHSGDLFTGSGNCLQAASLLFDPFADHTIYCDGDDTLIFANDLHDIDVIVDRVNRSGFELEVNIVEDNVHYGRVVPFCQQLFLERGDCGIVPNADRLMEKLFNIPYTSKQDLERKILGKIQAVQAYCALGLPGFPKTGYASDEGDAAEVLARYAGYVYDEDVARSFYVVRPPCGFAKRIIDSIVAVDDKCNRNFLASLMPGLVRRQRAIVGLKKAQSALARQIAEEIEGSQRFKFDDMKSGKFLVTPVCTHTHSQLWTSRFGLAKLLHSTRPMNSTKCGFTSFPATPLSHQDKSPSASTTIQATLRPQVLSSRCSSKEPGRSRSGGNSRVMSQQQRSGQPRPGDSPTDSNRTCSTSSSTRKQRKRNKSRSPSNTTPRSTPHKREKESRKQDPSAGKQAGHSKTPASRSDSSDTKSKITPFSQGDRQSPRGPVLPPRSPSAPLPPVDITQEQQSVPSKNPSFIPPTLQETTPPPRKSSPSPTGLPSFGMMPPRHGQRLPRPWNVPLMSLRGRSRPSFAGSPTMEPFRPGWALPPWAIPSNPSVPLQPFPQNPPWLGSKNHRINRQARLSQRMGRKSRRSSPETGRTSDQHENPARPARAEERSTFAVKSP